MTMNTIEVIVGIMFIIFTFVSMIMTISILEKANVEEKTIKKVLTVEAILGSIVGFLSLYIMIVK